jgi:hypothetical protein
MVWSSTVRLNVYELINKVLWNWHDGRNKQNYEWRCNVIHSITLIAATIGIKIWTTTMPSCDDYRGQFRMCLYFGFVEHDFYFLCRIQFLWTNCCEFSCLFIFLLMNCIMSISDWLTEDSNIYLLKTCKKRWTMTLKIICQNYWMQQNEMKGYIS